MRLRKILFVAIVLCFLPVVSCSGGSALGGRQTGVPNGAAARGASGQPAATTTPVPTPTTTPAGAHTLTFVNNCTQTIWVGALNNEARFVLPENGGWQLNQGEPHSIVLTGTWGGRFWGRTKCTANGGVFKCESGDCGGAGCNGSSGQPASLAEFYFSDAAGNDTYDVSLVDGFNLPISIAPTPGALPASGASGYVCGSPTCAADINATCPTVLQQKNETGTVIACVSACKKFNTPQTCCTEAYNTPQTCPATPLATSFKTTCPDAYSYAYDDTTSTYTCQATAYTITFCPSAKGAAAAGA